MINLKKKEVLMITIESVLSKKNIKQALNKLKLKDDDFDSDNQNWLNNQERIIASILAGTYEPSLITEYEIVSSKGKKRIFRFSLKTQMKNIIFL